MVDTTQGQGAPGQFTPIVQYNLTDAAELVQLLLVHRKSFEQHLGAFLFRGAQDANWHLVPATFRNAGTMLLNRIAKKLGLEPSAKSTEDNPARRMLEYHAVAHFYRLAESVNRQLPSIDSQAYAEFFRYTKAKEDWDRVGLTNAEWPPPAYHPAFALAQHYGVPTRFLDWTVDPFVAAYFAASDALVDPGDDSRFVVWMVQTRTIEACRLASRQARKAAVGIQGADVVYVPTSGNDNLAAQKGRFIVCHSVSQQDLTLISCIAHAKSYWPIVEKELVNSDKLRWANMQWTILKYTLPHSEAGNLLRELKIYGYEAHKIFPDLRGCARALEEEFLL